MKSARIRLKSAVTSPVVKSSGDPLPFIGLEDVVSGSGKLIDNNLSIKAAPDSVRRGAWFNVTVSVGVGSQHPSLQEHFVRYIALYKDSVEISRVYLHPVYSAPTVTFTIALDEGGALRALAEPTHSAAWEATRKIAVVP